MLWGLVLVVLFNLGSSRRDTAKTLSEFAQPSWHWSAASLLRLARAHLCDDESSRLYLIYAGAALGRPVDTIYLRTTEQWLEIFLQIAGGASPKLPPVAPITRPLVPYRDYLVEYPPGFFLWVLPPAWLTDHPLGYALIFSLWMALLLSLALILAQRIALPVFGCSQSLLPGALAAVLCLGTVCTHRYDAAIALLLSAALLFCIQDRGLLSGAALGLAVASKGAPLLVAPLFLLYLIRQQRYRTLRFALLGGLVTFGLVVFPFYALAGSRLGDAVRYHTLRPLQIESTWAALTGLLAPPGAVRVAFTFGARSLLGPFAERFAHAATPAILVGLGTCYGFVGRRLWAARDSAAQQRYLVCGVLAALTIFMVFGKVFSPQYLVWILPLGVLVSIAQSRAERGIFLAVIALTQLIYPIVYRLADYPLFALEPWALSLVLVRNLLLLLWAVKILARAGYATVSAP